MIPSLSTTEAEAAFNRLRENGFKYTDKNPMLRDILYEPLNNIMKEKARSGNGIYLADMEIGLELYRLLPPQELTLRCASDNGVWRFLSIAVVPDIVYSRWDDNPTRFWKQNQRIWLKTLWWFIHLSWQGCEETTRKILNELTTDEILQLVERPGSGYRVGLYREIMKQLHEHGNGSDQRNIFRIVMKLNTALLVSIEPEFANGGTPGYVNKLFQSAYKHRKKTPNS